MKAIQSTPVLIVIGTQGAGKSSFLNILDQGYFKPKDRNFEVGDDFEALQQK